MTHKLTRRDCEELRDTCYVLAIAKGTNQKCLKLILGITLLALFQDQIR